MGKSLPEQKDHRHTVLGTRRAFIGLFFPSPSGILGVVIYDLGGDPPVPFVLRREIEGVGHLELDHGDESKLFGVQEAQAGLCMGKEPKILANGGWGNPTLVANSGLGLQPLPESKKGPSEEPWQLLPEGGTKQDSGQFGPDEVH